MEKGKEKCTCNKCTCSNLMLILMIICVLLSLTTLGIVAYDKLVNNDSQISCK